MGLSRILAMQDKTQSSAYWPGRLQSRRLLRQAGDLSLKLNEQSQGAVIASNGSTTQHSPTTATPTRSAPPVIPTALADPQTRCPLFELPYELRLIIYELFLRKSCVIVADDRACSAIFRQNSRLMDSLRVNSQGSGTLRFAQFYQDDDGPITWCSRTPDSQRRPHERDLMGEIIVKPYSTNLMSTCKRICDEMVPVLYGRKTLVLALSSLLLNIKEDYFLPRSFAQIQHLHINQSWGERDDSWVSKLYRHSSYFMTFQFDQPSTS